MAAKKSAPNRAKAPRAPCLTNEVSTFRYSITEPFGLWSNWVYSKTFFRSSHANIENAEKKTVDTPTKRTLPCGRSGKKIGKVTKIARKNTPTETYKDFTVVNRFMIMSSVAIKVA